MCSPEMGKGRKDGEGDAGAELGKDKVSAGLMIIIQLALKLTSSRQSLLHPSFPLAPPVTSVNTYLNRSSSYLQLGAVEDPSCFGLTELR
jgi:hypothetical protein